ncbi:MAG: HlyC/CorC family transporter, partial [Oscillospiraceae bacterium]|nr:HlyC/CorC family transporter [Oscillospiraceae bacterium]
IATAVMTVLVLIFGEIIPKSLAKETADDGVMWMSVPLKFIMFILTPFSALFTLLKNGIIKLFNVRSSNTGVTADELLYIVNEGEEQGSLDEDESDLVRSAILFDGKNAEDILVPRVSLVAVEINQSVEEIKKVFVEEMYSRLPVYEKTIDSIVGIITFKSFMRLMEQGGTSIQSIIQKPLYVSTLKPINDIMQEMQKSKQHIAVVVDQFGGTEGIVTMEDIIEELVGEIYDESDEVLQPVIALGDDAYIISGELSVNDMLEKLGLPENTIKSEYTTVAGWALELFEGIPSENQTIDTEKFTVTAVKLDEQRVEKVRVVVKN